ncbi:MAG: SDR family oxidoreductase [Deltaproteobacteria bacterium]
MDLNDKAALVTGGGVGTGKAIALSLAKAGANVAINYSRSGAEAEETAGEIRAMGRRSVAIQADVADDAAVRRMVDSVVAELGGLDVLVNNAGTTVHVPHDDLEALEDDMWRRVLDVNLMGTFYAIRAARPHLEKTGGAILNVSSVAGVHATGSSIPYCASKAAINNLTLSMARVLGPKGVRVNAVAPGFIDTRWWQERPEYEFVKEFVTEKALLSRVATAQDVADMSLSIIQSDIMTGQIILMDAGLSL